MLYMIGIGLDDERDISLKGLEAVKKCDKVYLESYTSKLNCSVEDLEELYGKKIILSDRNMTEQGDEILKDAQDNDVAFLVIGDVFSATTHFEIYKEARENGIEVEVINNASVLNAVAITGLQLYKFGRTASIPYDNEKVETPYNILEGNHSLGLHTLFLLDIKVPEGKFMKVQEGIEYLKRMEKEKEKGLIPEDTIFIGCARLGSKDFIVKAGTADKLENYDFGQPPHCIIVPGNLHFLEEEAIEMWK